MSRAALSPVRQEKDGGWGGPPCQLQMIRPEVIIAALAGLRCAKARVRYVRPGKAPRRLAPHLRGQTTLGCRPHNSLMGQKVRCAFHRHSEALTIRDSRR